MEQFEKDFTYFSDCCDPCSFKALTDIFILERRVETKLTIIDLKLTFFLALLAEEMIGSIYLKLNFHL